MLTRRKMDRELVEHVVIDQLVPKEHLLRKIEAAVDFTQLYEIVEPLYCENNGRPGIDPVVLFKILLIQHLYGLLSLRRTWMEVSLNVAYRWFPGYTLQEEIPHFSTISYNFRHRFTEETVNQVFAWILEQIANAGYLSPTAVFIDGTHIKAFDEVYDCVICPEYQPLKYSTTDRDGYRIYKSDPGICANCPTRELCTHSKDCVKTVQRHIWKDYEELADDARYTPEYQKLYRKRKETIERVFADAKEKHAMRYTQYRGLAQVTNWVKLKFAAMNLKKLATWKWKDHFRLSLFRLLYPEYAKNPAAA